MWGEAKRPVSGSIRPLSAQAAAGLPFPGPVGRVFSSSLKNRVFLTVPQYRASANAAKTPPQRPWKLRRVKRF